MTLTVNLDGAKYAEGDYEVQFCKYGSNGLTAMILAKPFAADGTIKVTVNLPTDSPETIWLKGWAGNKGVPGCLIEAGTVELTGRATTAGHAQAVGARIIGEARELLDKTRAEAGAQ